MAHSGPVSLAGLASPSITERGRSFQGFSRVAWLCYMNSRTTIPSLPPRSSDQQPTRTRLKMSTARMLATITFAFIATTRANEALNVQKTQMESYNPGLSVNDGSLKVLQQQGPATKQHNLHGISRRRRHSPQAAGLLLVSLIATLIITFFMLQCFKGLVSNGRAPTTRRLAVGGAGGESDDEKDPCEVSPESYTRALVFAALTGTNSCALHACAGPWGLGMPVTRYPIGSVSLVANFTC